MLQGKSGRACSGVRCSASLASVLAVLCSAAGPARADAIDDYFDRVPKNYSSPQHFMLELKGGAYSPDIDKSPGLNGNTPFFDLFSDQYATRTGTKPADKPIFGIEFDYQFLHKFGSLGVGVSASFYRRTTHAFKYLDLAGSQTCYVPLCTRSGDETALNILPLELLAIYRFDYLALRYGWKFPLVPYLKGGLAYYLWFIQKGDSSLAASLPDAQGKTQTGIGGTFGLVARPGISVMLDALDPGAGKALDTELGINHVHVFAELNYAWITGLGMKDKMNLSDTNWTVGFGFEF